MKNIAIAVVLGTTLLAAGQAEAKGCIKGAILGGIAGHFAHHGLMGAAAGCAVGHHYANRKPATSGQTDPSAPPSTTTAPAQ